MNERNTNLPSSKLIVPGEQLSYFRSDICNHPTGTRAGAFGPKPRHEVVEPINATISEQIFGYEL